MHETHQGWSAKLLFAALAVLLPFLVGLFPSAAAAQTDTAWKARWDATVVAAKKEGKVVVWGPGGTKMRRAQEAFEKEFPGIRVEFSGGRGTSEAAKLVAQREGGLYQVDVFINGPTTANFNLKPYKALDPIDAVLILPEVTDGKNWLGGKVEFSDTDRKYNIVFFSQVQSELIYNPKLIKPEDVDTLEKLLDPKWKGKITVNDPSVTGGGVPWFRRLWVELGPEKAESFYRKLATQMGPITRDTRLQVEWVAHGKAALLIGPSTAAQQQFREKGVPLGELNEFKGVGAIVGSSVGTVSLINRAPNPNAAVVYINWLLSKNGQAAWQDAVNVPSRRLDVDKSDPLLAGSAPAADKQYWPSYTEVNQTLTPREDALIKELFGR